LKGRLRQQVERVWHGLGGSASHDQSCDCPICQMFGGPDNHPGRLRFRDALPVRGTTAPTAVRTHVAIDGARRVAREHHLFSVEVGPAAEFHACIRGHLPARKAVPTLALLAIGARLVRTIGGGKSRGLGWVQTEVKRVACGGQAVDAWQLRQAWERGVQAP
jgi:CRISPR/Cas system CSM-associated protein Csm3 (group 7 of RAMP superfamily)